MMRYLKFIRIEINKEFSISWNSKLDSCNSPKLKKNRKNITKKFLEDSIQYFFENSLKFCISTQCYKKLDTVEGVCKYHRSRLANAYAGFNLFLYDEFIVKFVEDIIRL